MLKWCVNTQRKRSFSMSVMNPLALWMWWGRTWSPGIVQDSVLNAWLPWWACFQSKAEGGSSAEAWLLYFAWVKLPMARSMQMRKKQFDVGLTISPYLGAHVGTRAFSERQGVRERETRWKRLNPTFFPQKNNWPYSLFISVQKCICPIHLMYDYITSVT